MRRLMRSRWSQSNLQCWGAFQPLPGASLSCSDQTKVGSRHCFLSLWFGVTPGVEDHWIKLETSPHQWVFVSHCDWQQHWGQVSPHLWQEDALNPNIPPDAVKIWTNSISPSVFSLEFLCWLADTSGGNTASNWNPRLYNPSGRPIKQQNPFWVFHSKIGQQESHARTHAS